MEGIYRKLKCVFCNYEMASKAKRPRCYNCRSERMMEISEFSAVKPFKKGRDEPEKPVTEETEVEPVTKKEEQKKAKKEEEQDEREDEEEEDDGDIDADIWG